MTGTLPATMTPRQAERRSAKLQVTGKLRDACLLLVFGGADGKPIPYDECARQAGLTTRAMRLAMAKGHVRSFLSQQRALLLASYHANNPLHVAMMRDSSTNAMVKLQAARLIEDMAGDVEVASARPRQPGVVINIIAAGATPPAPSLTLVGTDISELDE